MMTTIIMPKQGQSVESCLITKLYKKSGDKVSAGELIFSYETDKAGFDEESTVSGTVMDVYFNEGDEVPVLSPVMTVDDQDAQTDTMDTHEKGRIRISPRATKLAEKLGIDINLAEGTGPGGRIVEKDIEVLAVTAAQGEECREEYHEEKLSSVRKIISREMMNSLLTTAQLTMNTTFDATCILDFRNKLKETGQSVGLEKITITDMILFAVSRVLLKYKMLNAHLIEESLLIFDNVHIGVAVDTERGLLVPTLRNANLKSLRQISDEIRSMIEDSRKGSINPNCLKGASFTVTNLGMLGIESFTPVLNPPQAGILGIGTIIQRIRQLPGKYEFYPAMGLSLTFDHRILDGAPAARFLNDLKSNLENFTMLLAKELN